MSKEQRYFNFPIQLLTGFMVDAHNTLQEIFDYSLYALTLEYEHGNNEDKITSAKKYLSITGGNNKNTFKNGKILYDSIEKNSPMVGLSTSIWFDYYKNDKTDFEKMCFLGFLAIKSILQNKAYCKMTNQFWLSRMDGQPKAIELDNLSDELRKYANEYQTKKIKTELRNNWNLITYSRYTRGFYVSLKLNIDQLVFEAEKRRASTKNKQAKLDEKLALEKAMMRLNSTRP